MTPILPKYRILTMPELQELEKEFVDFLLINGIVADEWETLKRDSPAKADDLITLFSDVVFEGILRNVKFLEHRSPQDIRVFQCLKDQAVLVGISVGNSDIDLTDYDFLAKAMKSPPKGLKIYTTNKKYYKQREVELFELIESGCEISDGSLFKALSLAL